MRFRCTPAPEGRQHKARGQSDEGAATPGWKTKTIPSPGRGGSEFDRHEFAAAPLRLAQRLLASGHTEEEILKAYLYLEKQDIRAALAYATWRVEEIEVAVARG